MNAFFPEDDNLSRVDAADQFCTDGIQGTGFGRNSIAAVRHSAIAQGPETERVTESNQFGGGHQNAGIRSFQLLHGPVYGFFRGRYFQPF